MIAWLEDVQQAHGHGLLADRTGWRAPPRCVGTFHEQLAA